MMNALRIVGNFIALDDNICKIFVQQMGLLETLKLCMTIGTKAHKKEVLWVISNIAANSDEEANAIVKKGLLINLINGAKEKNVDVRKEAIWVISNLCYIVKDEDVLT
jgi:hypothetical protein